MIISIEAEKYIQQKLTLPDFFKKIVKLGIEENFFELTK